MKIIASILLAISFSASAESTYLYTEVSQPGETMDDFVVRIGPRAYDYTVRNGVEVCGLISISDEIISVQIRSGYRYSCLAINTEMNEGSAFKYFHTHVLQINQPVRFSKKDLENSGYLYAKNKALYTDGMGGVRNVN